MYALGILWRERLRALCELRSYSLFVRNLLVGFTRLAVGINFLNADVVVPCCSYGNPQWEVWELDNYGIRWKWLTYSDLARRIEWT